MLVITIGLWRYSVSSKNQMETSRPMDGHSDITNEEILNVGSGSFVWKDVAIVETCQYQQEAGVRYRWVSTRRTIFE